jgi:hypothetical protein
MAKGARSKETPNVGQTSTHPDTRVIDPGRRGLAGSAKAAPVPDPAQDLKDAATRAQKPSNPKQPVSIESQPTNESNASSLQRPLDPAASVPTKRTYDQGEKE